MDNNFYLYILESEKDQRFYIGQTEDLVGRLNAHQRGSVRSTKNRRPLRLVYFKSFISRSEVLKEEFRLKGYKNTKKFLDFVALNMAPSSNG